MDLLKQRTLEFWRDMIAGAVVTLDNEQQHYDIHESSYIDDNTLKLFVKMDTETGTITNAYVHDRNGNKIRSKDMNIAKGKDGLMITFFYRLEIKEE